jgi:glucokinase
MRVLALDVGGTEIKAAVLAGPAQRPEVLARRRLATPRGPDGAGTAEAVVAAATRLARELGAEHGDLDALGLVAPGVVRDGVGVYSANLGWRDFPFAARLRAATGLPVAFGQDVAAGGLAEHRLGAARGVTDAVVLPIGTGIAAALILDGRIRVGEIGHVVIAPTEPCGCGQTGCVEALGSAAAIARRYTARTHRPAPGAREVLAAAQAGDPDAAAVWAEAVDALARGILVLAALLEPEVVVLGGGLARAGAALRDPVAARYDELVTFQRRPELRLAELGDEAGSLGAGLLALEAAG